MLESSKSFNIVEKAVHHISWIMAGISGVFCGVVILIVVANVIGRYVLRHPVMGTIEIVEFLAVCLVFFSLPYTQLKRRHIIVEILSIHFSKRAQGILIAVMCIPTLVFVALMCWQGLTLGLAALGPFVKTTTTLSIPIFPLWFCLAFGCLIFILEIVLTFFVSLSSRVKDNEGGSSNWVLSK